MLNLTINLLVFNFVNNIFIRLLIPKYTLSKILCLIHTSKKRRYIRANDVKKS